MAISRSIAGFMVSSVFCSSVLAGGWQTDKGPDCILIDKQQQKAGECDLNYTPGEGASTFIFAWDDGMVTVLRLQQDAVKLNNVPATQIRENWKNSVGSASCYKTLGSETVFCARVLGLY
ncbi:hypothetical protein K1718_02000 [Roseibium porphyridii]|uniref:Uncharacterized protein n=1 Tax=Roseibium porphyridii TaxID=2866279 RepID=A0ABY8F3R8_9HYPH|nr:MULTISPECIES: hypothetical protein [Stappiaceae]QFT29152.1 hypothetical protein FIV00_01515 [Labrenzia sp. THAF82]WFE90145.1 hypothetical protein K1718_02000 [Roseibium sp. KMA01]